MEYTLEELKTYCGLMMLDLRGNWGYQYTERIEYLNDMLSLIVIHPDASKEDKTSAQEDIRIGIEEIEDGEFDGRVYRDCANYYGYQSREGLTDKIFKELSTDMTYPQYNIPGYKEEN